MSDSTSALPKAEGSQQIDCVDCQPDADDSSKQSTRPQLPAPTAAAAAAAATTSSSVGGIKEDLMDPSTFVPPLSGGLASGLPGPAIVIEYCQRCKFGLRANWIQQELLSTFALTLVDEESDTTTGLASILMIPRVDSGSSGIFRVWFSSGTTRSSRAQQNELQAAQSRPLQLVWDRKSRGGFPEMKQLKQLVRDHVQPTKDLGHSDRK